MKSWILHHHLLTGGVTSVIHTQCQAFDEVGQDYEVVVGNPDERTPGGKNPICLDSLNYLSKELNEDELKAQLNSMKEGLSHLSENGILHVHNLNLGKNPILNLAIYDLLEQGAKVVNHCHDFAEDNRPQNMQHLEDVISRVFGRTLEEVLYPKNQSLVYVIINKADRELLNRHGVNDDIIFDAPNAISPPKGLPKDPRPRVLSDLQIPDLPLVLYPVRAIARKNIPEILLLAALFRGRAQFAVTQPAKSPIEVEAVQPWVELASELNLPIVFEAGLKSDFFDLMVACDVVITTSINEGFGLGFLEPWLFGKSVVGRNLPQVTEDFKEQEIDFPCLYDQLEVDGMDFPDLSDEQKKASILSVLKNPNVAKSILEHNQLDRLLTLPNPDLISANHQKVLDHYSVSNYGKNLKQIYATSF